LITCGTTFTWTSLLFSLLPLTCGAHMLVSCSTSHPLLSHQPSDTEFPRDGRRAWPSSGWSRGARRHVGVPLLLPPRVGAPRPPPSSPRPRARRTAHGGRHGRPHLPHICHRSNGDEPMKQRSSSGTPPPPLALRPAACRQSPYPPRQGSRGWVPPAPDAGGPSPTHYDRWGGGVVCLALHGAVRLRASGGKPTLARGRTAYARRARGHPPVPLAVCLLRWFVEMRMIER
jgi:hypothetical protein